MKANSRASAVTIIATVELAILLNWHLNSIETDHGLQLIMMHLAPLLSYVPRAYVGTGSKVAIAVVDCLDPGLLFVLLS